MDETQTVELYPTRRSPACFPIHISPDLLVLRAGIAAGETWIDNQSVNWVIDTYHS